VPGYLQLQAERIVMTVTTLFYAGNSRSKWLRRAVALVDTELAALCRQNWTQPRLRLSQAPAYARVPIAVTQRLRRPLSR
jgi:hypothetical protein